MAPWGPGLLSGPLLVIIVTRLGKMRAQQKQACHLTPACPPPRHPYPVLGPHASRLHTGHVLGERWLEPPSLWLAGSLANGHFLFTQ